MSLVQAGRSAVGGGASFSGNCERWWRSGIAATDAMAPTIIVAPTFISSSIVTIADFIGSVAAATVAIVTVAAVTVAPAAVTSSHLISISTASAIADATATGSATAALLALAAVASFAMASAFTINPITTSYLSSTNPMDALASANIAHAIALTAAQPAATACIATYCNATACIAATYLNNHQPAVVSIIPDEAATITMVTTATPAAVQQHGISITEPLSP